MTDQVTSSRYELLLPEALREGVPPQEPSSVSRLLKIVETLFTGFETTLDTISDYFDPLQTDKDFLPWIASWVFLVLRKDWTEDQQRKVLRQIIPLYRKRGTKEGLEEYLKIYAGDGVTIREMAPLQIGTTSTVGVDMVVGGLPPYFFLINIAFTEADPKKLKEKQRAVEAVLDIEKPAFTFYKLNFKGPTLQVGEKSTIGTDTLI